MSTLVVTCPRQSLGRREYLRDLRDSHGEYTPGYWVTCKSLSGRALYFETYLTEYGAYMTSFLSVLFLLGILIIPMSPWLLLLTCR